MHRLDVLERGLKKQVGKLKEDRDFDEVVCWFTTIRPGKHRNSLLMEDIFGYEWGKFRGECEELERRDVEIGSGPIGLEECMQACDCAGEPQEFVFRGR